jgi:hypothetical protein
MRTIQFKNIKEGLALALTVASGTVSFAQCEKPAKLTASLTNYLKSTKVRSRAN